MSINLHRIRAERLLEGLPRQFPWAELPDLSRVGEFIGSGSEGIVFDYGPGRVIKFTLTPILDRSLEPILRHLKASHLPQVMTIYDYGMLGSHNKCWYIAEKLLPLSDEEVGRFNQLLDCSYNFRPWKKGVHFSKATHRIKVRGRMAKDHWRFIRSVGRLSIHHNDLYTSNIMKDHLQRYKMIDLDSLIFR